jgi:hypothetical protein
MASTYRLSGLTIFLILLAVLLIGYLLNHTWEYFSNRVSEGFDSDFTKSTYSTTLDGYSKNSKKVIKLVDNVIYFDPVNKALIETQPNDDGVSSTLYIKRRDNVDLSFNTSGVEYRVVEIGNGKGKIDFHASVTGVVPQAIPSGTGIDTIKKAKDAFNAETDLSFVYMDISGGVNFNDTDAFTAATMYKTADSVVATSNTEYPQLIDTKNATDANNYRRYERIQVVPGFEASLAEKPKSAVAQNISYTTKDNKYGVLIFPLSVNSSDTSISFIHVVNLDSKSHEKTFFFNGSQVEVINVNDKLFGAYDSNTYAEHSSGPADTSTLGFDGVIQDVKPSEFASNGEDLKVDASYNEDKKVFYFAARSDKTVVRAFFKVVMDENDKPIIELIKRDMSSNHNNGSSDDDSDSDDDASVASDDSDASDASDDSDDNNNSSGSNSATINELTNAMNLINSMQGLFGSSDSNYLLKTEVVPPVCPTCPSCPNSGVCTDCGGKGGSGTKTGSRDSGSSLARDAGTGATNLVRDGADGATNIARDAASGTLQVGKDVISGTKDTVGEVASGTGEFVKDGASGVYGAAKEVTQGTVGLGREIIQGVGGIFGAGSGGPGPSTASGGYYNSYGGPGGYGYPQPGPQVPGGYMNPGQYRTPGQDPYSYYGAVPPKAGGANYMPRTADFSSFGR